MPALNANTLAMQDVGNSCKPPKVICLPLDFTTNTQYTLNLQQLQDLGAFDACLSMYIDNRANGAALSVTFGGTGQNISCPKNAQGYFQVWCTNSPVTVTFTTTGGVLVNVFLGNMDVSNAVWVP